MFKKTLVTTAFALVFAATSLVNAATSGTVKNNVQSKAMTGKPNMSGQVAIEKEKMANKKAGLKKPMKPTKPTAAPTTPAN